MLGQVESCALETLTDISVTRSKWICCATTESDELAILDPANNDVSTCRKRIFFPSGYNLHSLHITSTYHGSDI